MAEQENEVDLSSATENYLNSLDEQSSTELDDQSEQSETNSHTDREQSAAIELDKIKEFKYNGKSYTTKDLDRWSNLQSEFTKTTQSLAQKEKYEKALDIDLAAVKANPSLASEFKKVYPASYHKLVDLVVAQETKKEQTSEKSQVDPKFLEEFNGMKSKIQAWEEAQYKAQVEADTQKLVAIEESMTKKYPKADIEVVYARMQSLIDSGQVDSSKIDKDLWDKVYKDVHEKFDKLTRVEQKEKFDMVKAANKKGSGIGKSGSAPAQAPKMAKNISEATDMFLEDLGKR